AGRARHRGRHAVRRVLRRPPSGRAGLLGGAAYVARRTAAQAAIVWAVAAAAMVLMTAADGAGSSVWDMLEQGAFGTLYDAMEPPNAWTVSALAAVIVAVVLRAALHWTTVAATLCLSVPAVVAPGMVGNNGQGPITIRPPICSCSIRRPPPCGWASSSPPGPTCAR